MTTVSTFQAPYFMVFARHLPIRRKGRMDKCGDHGGGGGGGGGLSRGEGGGGFAGIPVAAECHVVHLRVGNYSQNNLHINFSTVYNIINRLLLPLQGIWHSYCPYRRF